MVEVTFQVAGPILVISHLFFVHIFPEPHTSVIIHVPDNKSSSLPATSLQFSEAKTGCMTRYANAEIMIIQKILLIILIRMGGWISWVFRARLVPWVNYTRNPPRNQLGFPLERNTPFFLSIGSAQGSKLSPCACMKYGEIPIKPVAR